jgi:LPPG:FO 2-phospho-L-lactate transferase
VSALPRYVLLAGGVGGAKLALGFARTLQAGQLTIIANTGDDFTHLGLSISPDLDTLMYTLAGVVNETTGWGLRDETWSCMAGLEALGAETWFRLGDRDLATHLERTRLLAAGHSLTDVTQQLCSRLGVITRLLPMSDMPVRTVLDCDTTAGPATLSFQDYFVRQRAGPRVRAIHYEGASQTPPAATLAAALTDPDLAAIFIAPSNPWLSIEPILAIPSIRAAVRSSHAPVVAVSPIVAGQALKGPTAKIMRELGLRPSAQAVAHHYRDLLGGFILDQADAGEAAAIIDTGIAVAATQTVMHTLDDRLKLAAFALGFAATL